MLTRTQVIWTATNVDLVKDQVLAQIAILESEGKYKGDFSTTAGPEPGQITYNRYWSTLQEAEDWLNFINTLEPAPLSAAIVPDTLPE